MCSAIIHRSRRVSSQAIQSDVAELEEYIKSTQKQLDIQRPLIQLIDNMVKMLNDRSADRSTNSNSQVSSYSTIVILVVTVL